MAEDKMKEENGKEPEESQEEVKTDKLKHERLNQERRRIALEKERFKDFAKSSMRKGARGIDRRKRDKNLGGTRGRRGG